MRIAPPPASPVPASAQLQLKVVPSIATVVPEP